MPKAQAIEDPMQDLAEPSVEAHFCSQVPLTAGLHK
jgi:hypothetical protein